MLAQSFSSNHRKIGMTHDEPDAGNSAFGERLLPKAHMEIRIERPKVVQKGMIESLD